MPEAFFGLATALFWLGDLAGTIANCEKAYAGFRRRPDPMFAAGAARWIPGGSSHVATPRPATALRC